jgi:uncharacterized protein DUF5666
VGDAVHRVTQRGGLDGDDDDARVTGSIETLSGSCPSLRFVVRGNAVTTNGRTDFRKGSCGDARNGEDVEVRGPRQGGAIDARRVEFKKDE